MAPSRRCRIGLEPRDFAAPGRLGRFHTLGTFHSLAGVGWPQRARVEAACWWRSGTQVRSEAVPRTLEAPQGGSSVLEGVLGILEGSELSVAVHLELAVVGSVSSRRRHRSPARALGSKSSVTTVVHLRPVPCRAPSSTDTGRGTNWAGRRAPNLPLPGVSISGS